MSKTKRSSQRKPLFQTIGVLLVFFLSFVGFVLWAATEPDSELAQAFRNLVGIPDPGHSSAKAEPEEVTEEEAPPIVVALEEPTVENKAKVATPILPTLNYLELCRRSEIWPEKLSLDLSKRVYIRYNGNEYGYMQFTQGMELQVDSLMSSGEVMGWIDGNYLSLLVKETNLEDWFKQAHGDRYDRLVVETEPLAPRSEKEHKVGSPEGDAEFWADMRIWCNRNYDSISLEIQEDTLVFRWLPQEPGPIDFPFEARTIARYYLIERAARGSNENYAACEIRHPVTNELLGASSIFIPRL